MELVSLLAQLRRFWVLVLPGALLAILAGVSVMYHVSPSSPHLTSRKTTGGAAVGMTLLSASTGAAAQISSSADLTSTLPNRATMLADVMATDAYREDIARGAGIDPKLLWVTGPAAGPPPYQVPIATEGTSAASAVAAPYRVIVMPVASPPMVMVRAAAPDATTAGKLVASVQGTIADVLAHRGGAGGQLSSQPLGPVVKAQLFHAPSKVRAAAAALFVFAFWGAGVIVAMTALASMVRRRATMRPAAAR